MFEHVTPEQVGVSSESLKKYIGILEKFNLSIHSIMMIRHGKIFYENYWKPFNKDFLHRMYSVSKSFVSIAIGFLVQDGLINLDDPVTAYLDDDITKDAFEEIKNQTIRNMLMMSTGKTEATDGWFERKPTDRLRDYFESTSPEYGGVPKIPGTIFDYDSPGSFVLGSIVEIITGKKLMDYLREKLFDKIGVSKEAYCLSCPGGHSWGDSAVMCTSEDLARVTQFMLNGGSWNGEQILDRDYALELMSTLSIIMVHLSRFAEEIIMWCSWEFKFIELDDAFSTGSSIMPQKKNPDIAELVRGKTGRVFGDLLTLLTAMKGIPLAYNKDMQEDKEAVFDAVDTVLICVETFAPMLETATVIRKNMRNAAAKGFINATDCADYLVYKGLPFRDAYKATGQLVALCIDKELTLETLPIEEYKNVCDLFEEDVYEAIDLDVCVKKRTVKGGPSPECVLREIEALEEKLK